MRTRPLSLALPLLLAACGWNPSRPFEREAPAVNEALAELDAGDASSAASRLEDYLSTGPCKDGNIGTPERAQAPGGRDVRPRARRSFASASASVGASEKRRSTTEPTKACAPSAMRRSSARAASSMRSPTTAASRPSYGLGRSTSTGTSRSSTATTRAPCARTTARSFSRPATADAADSVGRDAAWNRAIALRRIDDKKDAGADASPDSGQDASRTPALGTRRATPEKNLPPMRAPKVAGVRRTPGRTTGRTRAPSPNRPTPRRNPTTPVLPLLLPRATRTSVCSISSRSAPTLQQEEAKRAGKKRVRGMADK